MSIETRIKWRPYPLRVPPRAGRVYLTLKSDGSVNRNVYRRHPLVWHRTWWSGENTTRKVIAFALLEDITTEETA